MSDSEASNSGVESVRPETVAQGRSVVRSRYRDRDFFLRRALLVADCLGLWLALAVSLVVSPHRGDPLGDSLLILPTLPAWAFLFRTYSLYRRPIRRFEPTHLDDVSTLFHALVLGTLGLWLFYKLMPVPQLSFREVLVFGVLALPLIAGLRVAVRLVNLRIKGPERVFVIAPIAEVKLLRRKLRNHPEYEMALVGAVIGEGASEELGLPLSALLKDIEPLLASNEVDLLAVQLDATYLPQEDVVELMRACHREGVRFGAFPREKLLLMPGVEVNHVEGMGILSYPPPVFSRTSRAIKRGTDLLVISLLLAIFAIPMALIAAAVKLDSKGSVLYRQRRVGKHGRRFMLAKFRTMVPEADTMTDDLMEQSTELDWLAIPNDPRITRVGHFLRHTSLDELPQLWNVLRGDMSLVGPRPLSERDDASVRGWERHRLDLVPGVTGPWQVMGRTSIPFREMVEIDYAYVTNWSMLYDLKLLLRTVPAVLWRRGAN